MDSIVMVPHVTVSGKCALSRVPAPPTDVRTQSFLDAVVTVVVSACREREAVIDDVDVYRRLEAQRSRVQS